MIEPGIHFGLPKEAYQADPSFSASGCKDMLVGPLTYWIRSPLNPDREENGTKATDMGEAFHVRLLEGDEAFKEQYAIKPDPSDYPDAIMDGKGLRERCGELGVKKGGSNAELCERILEADPDAVLWPKIVADWQRENEGKIALPYKQFLEVERQARLVDMQDSARKALSGGYPEVSLFWVDPETGVRMKARVDYMKVRAAVDLKSFSNAMDMPTDTAIARAMANYKYHVQGSVYCDGIEHAKALYRAKGFACVHGDPPKEWMDAWAAPGPHAFFFVFIESGDVPNVRVREFRQTETYAQMGASTNLYWQAGHAAYRLAVERYKQCMDTYGPDVPWVDPQPVRPFTDTDFPTWMFD